MHAVALKAQVSGFIPNGASNGQNPRDGIVMAVRPKLLPSAYAGIRVLRDVLKCHLPVEIWFHVDEAGEDFAQLAPLQKLAIYVGGGLIPSNLQPTRHRFLSRVFAIYNSHFNRVLFLDVDNIPVRDPTFLFSSVEFEKNGAIFWPDFWHPQRTPFNLHARSMVWELVDLPFVDMAEQESGQLLVDRTRHAAPLELVYFYAFHEPNFFRKLDLVYGDKDLFRLAG
ncbi:putative Mannosyltransferase [Phytophthora infestans]|uniref:Putative Mannosyltransferase n=1 Tax=Phytophthora infestans TaxID=4787 RepID=A0A8S9TZE5_PHYIN|nr:putative Mannosyltransferase [Phytophthora infestans]